MTDDARAIAERFTTMSTRGLVSKFDRVVALETAVNIAVELVSAAREAGRQQWQPIETAPKDGTVIIAALIDDYDKVWRVHAVKHNGLAFYTIIGGSVPLMTHWVPMPKLSAAAAPRPQGETK